MIYHPPEKVPVAVAKAMIKHSEDRTSNHPIKISDCKRRTNVRVRCLVAMKGSGFIMRWHDYTAIDGHSLIVKASNDMTLKITASSWYTEPEGWGS